MSTTATTQEWERFKGVIRSLYVGKGHPLQGTDGVIKLMENQHGFKKSKSQYETQFAKWGFQKHHTRDDWKIMHQKIEGRKRTGRESDVYLDGQLLPTKKLRKEISRQGYMTFVEQFNLAQETPPQTPPGFQIRTPTAQPVFRLSFENLPILRFQEHRGPLIELFGLFDTGSSALAPLFGRSLQTSSITPIHPIINALLPNSVLQQEECAKGLAIDRIENLGPAEFLNLTTFLISNNFPGETNREHLYQWLTRHGGTSVLNVLSSMKGPTANAMLEDLFRFAVEAEDIKTVEYLLREGINPNGHRCKHRDIPDTLNPLQFACIRGNLELAEELIKAGSKIDDPGAGWKCSALVLAIIGDGLRSGGGIWCDEDDKIDQDSESEVESEGDKSDQDSNGDVESEAGTDGIFNLINYLINAGAAVNLDAILSNSGLHGSEATLQELDYSLPDFMQHEQSPLTAASKYRNKELVHLFIQRGADIRFSTRRGSSALLECLINLENMEQAWYSIHSDDTDPWHKDSHHCSKVLGVVRLLLDAGANPNDRILYCGCFTYKIDSKSCGTSISYTALDLSVLIGRVDLVNLMLSAGAHPETEIAMEHAIYVESLQIMNCLLSAGAPVSKSAVHLATNRGTSVQYVEALLMKRQDIQVKRSILTGALRFGNTSVLEYLFSKVTSNPQNLIHESADLTSAMESCCSLGKFDAIRFIIDKSAEYHISISSSFSLSLYNAILEGDKEIINVLLSAGADVNRMTEFGETALLAAVKQQDYRLVEALISAGAMLNTKIPPQSPCFQSHQVSGDILLNAVQLRNHTLVNYLLKAGASKDAVGTSAQRYYLEKCACITPLTAAIIRGDSAIVNSLILNGAAINNPANYKSTGMTALSAAVRKRDLELASFLIRAGANPYDSKALEEATHDLRLLQFLFTALRNCEYPTYDKFLVDGALNEAIEKQNGTMVQAILDGPIKDARSIKTLSEVLYTALKNDSSPDLTIIVMLLNSGADPNTVWYFEDSHGDEYIESPLTCAIQKNSKAFEFLLQAGAQADNNLDRPLLHSPMQLAVLYKHYDMVRSLLDHGSNPSAVSLFQNKGTPIQLAVENKDTDMVKMLLQNKASPDAIFGDLKHTSLQMASRDGCEEIVELLLGHGADVNARPAEEFGATALQFAAMKGFLGIAYLLLEYGAEVNAPAAEIGGRTALEGAAENGRLDMMQLLLNAKANILDDGQSQYEKATRRASENGHHAVRRVLEEHHEKLRLRYGEDVR